MASSHWELFFSFGTDTLGWREKFPGLEPRICGTVLWSRLPVIGDLLARLGFIGVSGHAVAEALQPGRVVVVKVGGSQEALDANPAQYVLSVRSNIEFFRAALTTGASLVPCFGFGENSLYTASHGSLRGIQLWIQHSFGVVVPLPLGRTVATYNLGVMPHRSPLSTVVGVPIHVQPIKEPTDTQIEELVAVYVDRLRALFEEWQPHCEPDSSAELVII